MSSLLTSSPNSHPRQAQKRRGWEHAQIAYHMNSIDIFQEHMYKSLHLGPAIICCVVDWVAATATWVDNVSDEGRPSITTTHKCLRKSVPSLLHWGILRIATENDTHDCYKLQTHDCNRPWHTWSLAQNGLIIAPSRRSQHCRRLCLDKATTK